MLGNADDSRATKLEYPNTQMQIPTLDAPGLPSEIFLAIFSHPEQRDVRGVHCALSLSAVSRRLRSLALSITSLWSTLSNSLSEEELLMFITRSPDSDLVILVNSDVVRCPPRISLTRFFGIVILYAARWKEFHFSTALLSPTLNVENIIPYRRLGLPRLTYLYVDDRQRFQEMSNINSVKYLEQRFYKFWSMSSLQLFEGKNTVPLLDSIEWLSVLSLEFHGRTAHLWDLEFAYSSNLTCLKTLSALSLTFQDLEYRPALFPFVALATLEQFTLCLRGANAQQTIHGIMGALHLPNVTNLIIDLHTSGNMTAGSWISSAAPFADWQSCSSLRSCTIKIGNHESHGTSLNDLFIELVQIHHLTIEAPNIFSHTTLSAARCRAPLHSLTFRKSPNLGLSFVESVVFALRGCADWEQFERLRFISCGQLSDTVYDNLSVVLGEKLQCS